MSLASVCRPRALTVRHRGSGDPALGQVLGRQVLGSRFRGSERSLIFCTIVAGLLLVTAALAPAFAQRGEGPDSTPPAVEAVTARHGMVVAQEARAARIGADVLRHGGNAVDAAVATGFAMAVTYPRAGNIGGGG